MNRYLGLVVFVPFLLFLSSATPAQEVPDPFGPTTLQARALRGLTGEIATLILKADPGGELAMEALAVPLLQSAEVGDEPGTEKQRVAVVVEIDGTSFLEMNQSDLTRLEIYVYALRDQGFEIGDYRAEVVAVDVANLGEVVWQSGLKYFGELALEPGTYRLRALIRNFQSKAAGLREIPLVVPAASDGPQLSTPLLTDPEFREPWVPIRPWSKDLIAGLVDEPLEGLKTRTRKPYPFSMGEQVIRPAARRVLVPGHASTVYLHGRFPASDNGFRVQLMDASIEPAKLLGHLPLSFVDRVEQGDRAFVEATFMPPEDLPAGLVELRVEYPIGHQAANQGAAGQGAAGQGAAGSRAMSPPVAVHLMDSSVREQNLLWSDLRWRGTGEAPSERPASARVENTPSREKGGRKVGKLTRQYEEILAGVDQLGTTTTMSDLLDFETRTLNEGSRKAAGLLQTAEYKLAESLSESDPESLVPLIQLHQDLYLAYRGRRMFSLGTHSRVLMERIAELYAEKGSGQGSKIVAARALTSLAGYLQAGGLASTSQRLYRRALELDPTSKTAMLALACGYERLGAYDRAKETLQQLTSQYPKMSEAWLRLAMSTTRLGQRVQSRKILEQVVELDGPHWIRSLAYEELARIHLFLDQTESALALLEQVQEPSEGTLFLMAFLYDRSGKPNRSLEMLNQVQAKSGRAPSPRKKYDGWPEQALAETRKHLLEAAGIRLSRLQDAVAGSRKPGGKS